LPSEHLNFQTFESLDVLVRGTPSPLRSKHFERTHHPLQVFPDFQRLPGLRGKDNVDIVNVAVAFDVLIDVEIAEFALLSVDKDVPPCLGTASENSPVIGDQPVHCATYRGDVFECGSACPERGTQLTAFLSNRKGSSLGVCSSASRGTSHAK
jgi:hypothetical protein